MNWMQTFSGRKVDLEYPKPEDISIEDIAHALSRICRYGGHCKDFYSVAEHSLLVEKVIDANFPDCKPMSMAALLHDAAEAYLGDIITPLKKTLTQTTYIEGRWLDTIAEKFKLSVKLNPLPRSVKSADKFILAIEVKTLFSSTLPDWGFQPNLPKIPSHFHPRCLSPAEAEKAFLTRFHEFAPQI
jgi:hypothetical protein